MTQNSFTIGTLAKKVGVNVETIRFYQRRGLFNQPAKPFKGVRLYTERDAQRLRFIKQGQKLGFSLDEVAELLRIEDGQHCREAKEIALKKLVLIRQRIEGLRAMEASLSNLVECCNGNTDSVPCPIIHSLNSILSL